MRIVRLRLAITAALGAAVLSGCSSESGGTTQPPTPGAAVITGDISSDRTFYAETTYTLGDWVHVTNNARLTIQAGTRIEGRTGSALFILPGAQIIANGRADAPIVFTSDQPAGNRKPGDWGGLIIIGRGIINRTGTVELEGTGSDARNYVLRYDGGTDNNDNSGTLRYVRVEFAGFGVAPNQELNSFTFAAVGRGTTVEYLQALGGLDDHFEWFGGAVDTRYLVSYESADDHFDSAEGHVGRNQYLIGFQSTILEPRANAGVRSTDPQGFEVDGCGSASGSGCAQGYDSAPLNVPMFANWTLVGTGPNPDVESTSGGVGMVLRRGTGGYYVNGILARWPRAAISLRDPQTQARFNDGTAAIRNVLVVETGTAAGSNAPLFEGGTGRFTIDAAANGIELADNTVTTSSLFTAFPAAAAAPTLATLDFSLPVASPARSGGLATYSGAMATAAGSFVTGTTFRGAADPSGVKWWQGWTSYARN